MGLRFFDADEHSRQYFLREIFVENNLNNLHLHCLHFAEDKLVFVSFGWNHLHQLHFGDANSTITASTIQVASFGVFLRVLPRSVIAAL